LAAPNGGACAAGRGGAAGRIGAGSHPRPTFAGLASTEAVVDRTVGSAPPIDVDVPLREGWVRARAAATSRSCAARSWRIRAFASARFATARRITLITTISVMMIQKC